MAERKKPVQVARAGNVRVPVYRYADGRYCVAWRPVSGEAPKRETFTVRREAEARAAEMALAIANGQADVLELTHADRESYLIARRTLAPLGVSLHDAVTQFAAARQRLGAGRTLAEAVDALLRNDRQDARSTVKTSEVVAHYIRSLSADGVTQYYVHLLEADLQKFAGRFDAPMSAIEAGAIEDWLRAMPVGLRRRRKLRDQIVALFKFGRENKYLPESLRTEAEKIKRPKVPRKAPPIYTPEELDLLIQQCAQPSDRKSGRKDYYDFLPALVIAAFAGLRWAEILRLEWKHIHWKDAVVEVGEENKTGYRLVPIQPNLATWLAEFRTRTGKVCPVTRPDNIIRRLGMRAGLNIGGHRYANAFRHSCLTYRVAVTKNMPLVAMEAGNSVTELKKSYNRASLEETGQKWFSISRETGENVLQMPLLTFVSK